MNRIVSALCLLLLASNAPAAPPAPCGPGSPAQAPAPGEVLEVGQVMEMAVLLEGPLRVDGLVKKAYPRQGMLGLGDATAFKKGALASDCCVLPVRWNGAMPPVGTLVRLEGEIRKVDGKMEFLARSIEKVVLK